MSEPAEDAEGAETTAGTENDAPAPETGGEGSDGVGKAGDDD